MSDQATFADLEEEAARIAEAAWLRSEEGIQAAFERFHAEHPEVYRMLVRFARQLKARGYSHAGIKLIWERMRWETMLGADRALEPFKLCNNHHSRYARLIMAQERDLEGFFRTRELKAI